MVVDIHVRRHGQRRAGKQEAQDGAAKDARAWSGHRFRQIQKRLLRRTITQRETGGWPPGESYGIQEV